MGKLNSKPRFWGETIWNENTWPWNDFLARFFNTCSYCEIFRMVVYAIPCILLFGAEWTAWVEWKSGQSLGNNKMADQNKVHPRQIWIIPPSLREKTRSRFSVHFWNNCFLSCFKFQQFWSFLFCLFLFQKRPRERTHSHSRFDWPYSWKKLFCLIEHFPERNKGESTDSCQLKRISKTTQHVCTAILIVQDKWELFRLGSKQTAKKERDHWEVPYWAPAD